MDVPIAKSDTCIELAWVEKQNWTPVNLEAGEL
jgi:hypothetical protein